MPANLQPSTGNVQPAAPAPPSPDSALRTPSSELRPPAPDLRPPSSDLLPFSPAANESAKAFETFLCYFDIGQNRSFAKVAKLSAVSLATVKQWAHRFDWRERVRAYNTHLLRTRLAVETDARRNQAELRAERTRIFQDAEWKAAEKLLRAAQNVLDVLLQTTPDKLSLSDVARALEIASKLGRLATGLATEQIAHGGEVNVNLQLEIESAIQKVYGPVIDVSPATSPLRLDRGEGQGEVSTPAPGGTGVPPVVGQVSKPAGAGDFPVASPAVARQGDAPSPLTPQPPITDH